MKQNIVQSLTCPECFHSDFLIDIISQDDIEIREGRLNCRSCQTDFPVKNGVLNFLHKPDEVITKEINGWEEYLKDPKFAHETNDNWILSLPRPTKDTVPDESLIKSWTGHAENFESLFNEITLTGKERVLELGAGRCWASAKFSNKGCNVVATDILEKKYMGLETADIFFRKQSVYFERVLLDMRKLHFKDNSFDIVFSTASIHHCSQLNQLFSEINRVLVPSGKLIFCNDPIRDIFNKVRVPECKEVELGINENEYTVFGYLIPLLKNSFKPHFYFPAYWRKQLFSAKRNESNLIKRYLFKWLSFFWKFPSFRNISESFFSIVIQIFYGFGASVIAVKRK